MTLRGGDLNLRFPLALLAALASFVIPAGSAFASTATFTSPVSGATISHGQTFSVDTTGLAGVGDVLISSSTDGGATTQFQSHCRSNGTPMLYNPATNAADIPCTSGSGVYKINVNVGGWSNGPITFVALINDSLGNPIGRITENVTIDNASDPLVVSAASPSTGSTVSGAFTLSVTPAAQNNTITRVHYSIDGGVTYSSLSAGGSGSYTASIDTVAAGIPNGDSALDVRVLIDDTAGNELSKDYV